MVVLPAPLGPEQAEHGAAADLQRDAVERPDVPSECLDQAVGHDRGSVHPAMVRARRRRAPGRPGRSVRGCRRPAAGGVQAVRVGDSVRDEWDGQAATFDDDPVLWGGPITDERYLVHSRR